MKITTSRPFKEMGSIIIGCEIKSDLSPSVASFAWGVENQNQSLLRTFYLKKIKSKKKVFTGACQTKE